ncbi:DUF4158 domain-containing protein [Actinoallomurus acanthiterrae]
MLNDDELIGNWTLVGDERALLSGRRGATRLGFALLLRFYAVHGRFPTGRGEIPDQAVAYVARLVDVSASELALYEWDGRTIKAHRAHVRGYFGFRECSVPDAAKAAEWLATNVCEKERRVDRVREYLLANLREERRPGGSSGRRFGRPSRRRPCGSQAGSRPSRSRGCWH